MIGRSLQARVAADVARQVEAVHARHLDVRQHHRRPLFLQPLQRLQAVGGQRHAVAFALQQTLRHAAHGDGVVHHQHQRRSGRCRRPAAPVAAARHRAFAQHVGLRRVGAAGCAPARHTRRPAPPGCRSAPRRPKPAPSCRPGRAGATAAARGSSPRLPGCPALRPRAGPRAAPRCGTPPPAGSCPAVRCCVARPAAAHPTRRTAPVRRRTRKCRRCRPAAHPRAGARRTISTRLEGTPNDWAARCAASPPASPRWSAAAPCGRWCPGRPASWFRCGRPGPLTSERTTSMPMPRPASSLTSVAVEKPGRKIRSAASASLNSSPGSSRPCALGLLADAVAGPARRRRRGTPPTRRCPPGAVRW